MNQIRMENSKFLMVDSEDVQRIASLSTMFPKLTNMIRNNKGKNLVLNFRDESGRSLIVMVVSKATDEPKEIQMAS